MLPRRIVHRMLVIILLASLLPPLVTGAIVYLQRDNMAEHLEKEMNARFAEIEKRVRDKMGEAGKTIVKQKAMDLALQIEMYLKLHPSTINDLLSDKRFKALAVQPVGERGYTFVIAPALRLTLAHPDPKVSGHVYTKLISGSPELAEMFKKAQRGIPVMGTYRWASPSDTPPPIKLAFLFPVRVRTKDGVMLMAGATSPVKEFMVPSTISHEMFEGAALRMRRYVYNGLNVMMLWVAVIFVCSLVVGCTLAYYLASHLSQHITAVKEGMEQVNRGDLSARVEVRENGELKELGAAFNSMVERLKESTISREFLETVIQSLPSGIALVDKGLRVLSWNRAAEEITGFSKEEAVGKSLCHILKFTQPSPTCEKGELSSEPVEGEMEPVEKTAVSRTGESIQLLLQFSRLHHVAHSEAAGIISFIDITTQKQLEQQLSHAQRMEAIGVLAAGIAHDFNNMLGAIMGNLNLISMTADGDGNLNEIKSYADSAEKVVQQAAQVTKRLLAFTRQAPVVMRTMNPGAVVKEAVEILSRTIDRRIAVKANLQENLWKVQADASELQQVLINLGINAKDSLMDRMEGRCPHSTSLKEDPPEITISATNEVIHESYVEDHPYAKTGNFVRLSVKDNGCGMDKATISRVFDPFFTTKELSKGTGLGLATVYGMVKQHRGWITVESELGRGSEFTFYIPAVTLEKGNSVATRPECTITKGPWRKKDGSPLKVLLVDDESFIREIGQTILEHLGHEVVLAKDGEEAIELYERVSPHVVLLDLTMPVLSGKEALRQILEKDPKARVIISSGHAFDSSAKELIEMGAALYVQKPYRIKEIKAAIEKVVQGD